MATLPRFSEISDYAMIGDCRSGALVSRNGSIDWLCLPRFDSAACFAALLGTPEHGRWQIKPRGRASVTRQYADGSLILQTDFKTSAGTVRVTDFMPIDQHDSSVIRLVTGLSGRVVMEMDLVIRFDYGLSVPWVSKVGKNIFTAIAGPDMLTLRTKAEVRGQGMRSVAQFTVAKGQTVPFVLTNSRSYHPIPKPVNIAKVMAGDSQVLARLVETLPGCRAGDGPGAALADHPEGTDLPADRRHRRRTHHLAARGTGRRPQLGLSLLLGADATFTLLAFMNAGYQEEAEAWRDWLMRAIAGSPEQLQIMYGIAGERRLTNGRSPGCPVIRNRRRCGSATPPRRRRSSMCTAS